MDEGSGSTVYDTTGSDDGNISGASWVNGELDFYSLDKVIVGNVTATATMITLITSK